MPPTKPQVIHNTFVIERSYPQPVSRVFSAFSQPGQKRHWYAENDHETVGFEMDFRIGGRERARYRFKKGHQFAGVEIDNQSIFQDIVPEKRIVVSASMTFAGQTISIVLVTFEFFPAASGTDLICTHQGVFFENSDGPVMREQGWKVIFDRLGEVLSQNPPTSK
jgi:uncharacterized protein YndB with AHSA1/START domain